MSACPPMAGAMNDTFSWGYLPHEEKYNRPTIDGRAAAVTMKGGYYDARSETHDSIDQAGTREDTTRAWYDERSGLHPFERTTTPTQKSTTDFDGKYSWSTAVRHAEHGRLETGPLARQLIAGSQLGEAWQHQDPLLLDMYRRLGGASVMLRHFARIHEVVTRLTGWIICRVGVRVLLVMRLGGNAQSARVVLVDRRSNL